MGEAVPSVLAAAAPKEIVCSLLKSYVDAQVERKVYRLQGENLLLLGTKVELPFQTSFFLKYRPIQVSGKP